MEKIKIGIIGCGTSGIYHIKGFQKQNNAEIVAICEKDKNKLIETAKKYSIPNIFTDYTDLIQFKEIDAISICTPNYMHFPMTIEALKNKKHVLCEKPPAINTKETQIMLDTALKNKKLLMYAFCLRFSNDSEILKEIISKNKIGKVYHIEAYALRRKRIPEGWFRKKKYSGGGCVIDIGVHIIDLNMYLINNFHPISVSANVYKKYNMEVEDSAAGFIRFKNDVTMNFEVSWASHIPLDRFDSFIFGTKGSAHIDRFSNLKIYIYRNDKIVDISPSLTPFSNDDIYAKEIAHFLSCISKNKISYEYAQQGIIVQHIIDKIYESSLRKKEVRIKL
jgi:predicted dehydrogenase